MFLLIIGVAHALDYNIKMDVFPQHNDFDTILVNEGEEFLVFGYIYVNNENNAISPSQLELVVIDTEGDVVDSYSLNYISKSSNNDFVFNGYFYKTIEIDDEGDYVVRIEAGDVSKEFEIVSVDNSVGDRDIKVNLLDYSINNDKIKIGILVENEDSADHDITIYFKGENNFENPKKFEVTVPAGESKTIEKEYALSAFGEDKFILVAQAYVDGSNVQELLSSPDYLEVNIKDDESVAFKESLEISDIVLSQITFFPGDVIEGKLYIKNHGTTLSQYRFEYVFDNFVFKKGDVGFVEPGQTAVENFFLEIPEKDSIEVTFRIYNENTEDEVIKTFLISQKTKYFFVTTNVTEQVINAGENSDLGVIIINTGNQRDVYTINVSDWDYYEIDEKGLVNGLLFLEPDEEFYLNIIFNIPKEIRVGTYNPKVTICNSEDKCYEKEVSLTVTKPESEQTEISWNNSQDEINYTTLQEFNYTFTIKNIGAAEKDYKIEIGTPNGTNYTIDENEFTLDVDEEKEIIFTIIPNETKDYEINLTVYAENEIIFEKEIKLNYVGTTGGLIFTGMFAFGPGEVYLPALVALAIIGAVISLYLLYFNIKKKVWTEKVLAYNQTHPQKLTRYPQNYWRENQ